MWDLEWEALTPGGEWTSRIRGLGLPRESREEALWGDGDIQHLDVGWSHAGMGIE